MTYRVLMILLMLVELVLLADIDRMERRAPVGRYEQFGFGALVLDTKTGRVCDTYPARSTSVEYFPPCPEVGVIITPDPDPSPGVSR